LREREKNDGHDKGGEDQIKRNQKGTVAPVRAIVLVAATRLTSHCRREGKATNSKRRRQKSISS